MRLSGPQSRQILEALTRRPAPPARLASLRRLFDPVSQAELDQALILYFEQAKSFTGDESVEFHLHGSPLIARKVAECLEHLGARLAEPGEFSRRAVLNGQLSLSEAEGIGSLIAAQTEAQHKHALRLLEGEIGKLVAPWRDQIIQAAALLETSIDFVDEGLDIDITADVSASIEAMTQAIDAHLSALPADNRQLEKVRVILLGPPNAGKSSLLNAIIGENQAIVSGIAGTTRDAVRGQINLMGFDIELIDTAGLRESSEEIERIGIERARSLASAADIRIYVASADTLEGFGRLTGEINEGDYLFWNKSDLGDPAPQRLSTLPARAVYSVSAKDGSARAALSEILVTAQSAGGAIFSPISGSARRERLLKQTALHCQDARKALQSGSLETASEDLKSAAMALELLIGRIDAEDVLDEVFSKFCIGK
ncbi:MAG: tRNA uridine-5-carboxymethylaminomethyl(34) synthesis GTPase MnmE [Neomegalonema sp.]|nr:tRNA uridine-5-carboxymethylaminomethyl(34) synthesis GTPase MnmE [Neomegalonema sp.]